MPEERKKRTEEFLRECGIPVDESLPPIVSEHEADIKSAEKIMKRATTAFLASMIALKINEGNGVGRTASLYVQYLEAFGLEKEATKDEKRLFDLGMKFLPKKPDKEFIAGMIMRFERCMPLFWSCGITEGDLEFPSGVSNRDSNRVSEVLSGCGSFKEVMAYADLRKLSEILENADQAYRMYSACRKAVEKGEAPPAGISIDVIVEQHKGFCWITGEYGADGWDGIEAWS